MLLGHAAVTFTDPQNPADTQVRGGPCPAACAVALSNHAVCSTRRTAPTSFRTRCCGWTRPTPRAAARPFNAKRAITTRSRRTSSTGVPSTRALFALLIAICRFHCCALVRACVSPCVCRWQLWVLAGGAMGRQSHLQVCPNSGVVQSRTDVCVCTFIHAHSNIYIRYRASNSSSYPVQVTPY